MAEKIYGDIACGNIECDDCKRGDFVVFGTGDLTKQSEDTKIIESKAEKYYYIVFDEKTNPVSCLPESIIENGEIILPEKNVLISFDFSAFIPNNVYGAEIIMKINSSPVKSVSGARNFFGVVGSVHGDYYSEYNGEKRVLSFEIKSQKGVIFEKISLSVLVVTV